MLEAGGLKKFVIVLADDVLIIIKNESGQDCQKEKTEDDEEADHGTFVLFETFPCLSQHAPLLEFCVFHMASSACVVLFCF